MVTGELLQMVPILFSPACSTTRDKHFEAFDTSSTRTCAQMLSSLSIITRSDAPVEISSLVLSVNSSFASTIVELVATFV